MHNEEDKRYLCVVCGGFIDHARYKLGYKLCKPCGEAAAKKVKRCVVNMNKMAYMMVTDLETLKQLNPKRTS